MVKVGLVKEPPTGIGRGNGLMKYMRGMLPAEITPLSGVLPGQRQVEFWRVEQGRALGKNCRKFARRMEKQHMAVCGGNGWTYGLEQRMQQYNGSTIFTGGFSLSLFVIFDFLLKRAHLWRRKDIAILDADNQLGRFTALVLGTEARLLLLTGKNQQALELLGEEILAKTGLAVRIVSEEKALHWAQMAFLAGAEKRLAASCVMWDLAAVAGLRPYAPGAAIGSRFAYPAYGKEYLSAGWLSAMVLAQYEASEPTDWRGKTPSEKVFFWRQGWDSFGVRPIFLLQKENGKAFYQIFGQENLW